MNSNREDSNPWNTGFNQSLWYATSEQLNQFSVFEGDHESRVAIVGGGVTGISAALHIAKLGIGVTVLEADEIGSHATGRSGGFVVPDFVRHSPAGLVDQLGEHWAKRMISLVGGSGSRLFELVKEQGINCDAESSGWLCPAHNKVAAKSLIQRAKEWNQHGWDVEVLQKTELEETLGTDYFDTALHNKSGGHLNPLAYVRGLAKAALSLGATIHAQSKVTQIARKGEQWQLKTQRGNLVCDYVLLCNNSADPTLNASLGESLIPMKVLQMATKPLDAKLRESILPHNHSVTGTNPYVFSMRYDASGRMITGQPPVVPEQKKSSSLHRHVTQRLANIFPQLSDIEFEYTWQGTIMLSPSCLPKLVALDQGMYAVQSCNGRALSVDTSIGAVLADLVNGAAPEELPLKLEPAHRISFYPISKRIPPVLVTGAKYLDKLEDMGRRVFGGNRKLGSTSEGSGIK